MYDPKIGQFLSEDFLGLMDDVNPRRYVKNDPLNKTDPTGMYAEPAPATPAGKDALGWPDDYIVNHKPFTITVFVDKKDAPRSFNITGAESQLQQKFDNAWGKRLFYMKVNLQWVEGQPASLGSDRSSPGGEIDTYSHYIYWNKAKNPDKAVPSSTLRAFWAENGIMGSMPITRINYNAVEKQCQDKARRENRGDIPYDITFGNILGHEVVFQGLLGYQDRVYQTAYWAGTITDKIPNAFVPTVINKEEALQIKFQTRHYDIPKNWETPAFPSGV